MKHIEYTYKPTLWMLFVITLFTVVFPPLGLLLVRWFFSKNLLIITDTEISVLSLLNTTVKLAGINDIVTMVIRRGLFFTRETDQYLIITYGNGKKELRIYRSQLPNYRAFENVCELLATLVEAAKNGTPIQLPSKTETENQILEKQSIQQNFCSNCGSALAETSVFCSTCGTPVNKNTLNVQPDVGQDKVICYDEVPFYRKRWFLWVSFILFPPLLPLILWTGDGYYTKGGWVKTVPLGIKIAGSIYAVVPALFYIAIFYEIFFHAPSHNKAAIVVPGQQGIVADSTSLAKTHTQVAQDDAKAQFNLGVRYENGQGVTKNETEAVNWYRKAAEQGFAQAQYNLGMMYLNGQGVTKNETDALTWFRKAAEQGFANAQNNLGVMYENGQGVTKNKDEAVKWYRKAAEQGYANAQFNLGVIYANGQGVIKDEAVNWYRLAAEQGYANAQYNLGVMYLNGQGVTKNEAEAANWFRKAAEHGLAAAQNNLGGMYVNGQGVTKDEIEAVKWYRKAAAQGDADAQNNLDVIAEAEAKRRAKQQADNTAGGESENLIPSVNNKSDLWFRVININEFDTLNMRTKASTRKSPIVYKIPFNEDCIRGTEETQIYLNKVWRKITVNNRTGWVNSEFLTETSGCE